MSKVDIRRQNILKHISENKTVSTKQIMELFNIKKATLSEDITALKSQGVPLITTRGFVSIEDNKSSANYYEKISNSTIRQWLILFILSQSNKPITFKTIQEEYQNYNYGYCSTDSLHKDLQTLQANNYIHYSDNNHTYKLTNKYNHYITPLYDNLEPFCEKYASQIESNPNALELKRFHDTAKIMLFGFEDDDSYQPNENYIVHGKRNLLDEATKKAYDELNLYPYEARKLDITYNSKDGIITAEDFSVGLVVYSIEKNRMYLLGEILDKKIIIAVDTITKYNTTKKRNTIYNSPEYMKIFNEMFSVSVDDLETVEVIFDNRDHIRYKLDVLKSKRPNSQITLDKENDTLIYTDKLRGISDFASYIRQYGRGAVATKPEYLHTQMLESAERIIKNYKEVHHYE